MRKKILIFLTLAAGLATVVSGYWWYADNGQQTTVNRQIQMISEPNKKSTTDKIKKTDDDKKVTGYRLQVTTTPQLPNSPTTSTTSPPPETNPEEQFTSLVTLEIDHIKLLLPYADGMTAEDAMKEAMKKYPDTFSYHGTTYGTGLGTFIEEINGIRENYKEKMHWILYINGKKSNKGISTLILKPDDIIKWNYEKEIL